MCTYVSFQCGFLLKFHGRCLRRKRSKRDNLVVLGLCPNLLVTVVESIFLFVLVGDRSEGQAMTVGKDETTVHPNIGETYCVDNYIDEHDF